MDIRIQSIHFDATAKLEAFIDKKISKLEHHYDGIQLAEVVLKVVKPETVQNKDASIKLKIKSGDLFAEKIADTFEGAIDDCIEALSKQLSKFKDKSVSKKKVDKDNIRGVIEEDDDLDQDRPEDI
jgi:ribosomal subunit interface protein